MPKSTLVVCAGQAVSFLPLIPNSAPTHTLALPHAPSSASLHPTLGDRFVAGSTADPWVRVYGLEDGVEREVYKGHHGPVHCVEYSPDGEMYASGSGMCYLSRSSTINILRSYAKWTLATDSYVYSSQRTGLFVSGRRSRDAHTGFGKALQMQTGMVIRVLSTLALGNCCPVSFYDCNESESSKLYHAAAQYPHSFTKASTSMRCICFSKILHFQ